MQINLEILGFASVEDNEKCSGLNEKTIVTDMMLRRRLTRNARIALFLADQIGDWNAPIVIGNAYGEVVETFNILKSIAAHETVSPTTFQNSVHNTPASYLSIVEKNQGYITTVSDLYETSKSVLKVGAVKALSHNSLVVMVCDSIDFECVTELNQCDITKKECGVALKVRYTEQNATLQWGQKKFVGYSPSVWSMLEIAEHCKNNQNVIIGIEI